MSNQESERKTEALGSDVERRVRPRCCVCKDAGFIETHDHIGLVDRFPCDNCQPSPGDARCGFCDGPMPCFCEDPLTPEERDAFIEEDLEARNNVDLPHEDEW